MVMDDPLQPHWHEPNPAPPSEDETLEVRLPNGRFHPLTLVHLLTLPKTTIADCYIISTGHGISGPFTFGGVQLVDVVQHFWQAEWTQVEVVSADGFGNRVMADELFHPGDTKPILLAYERDGILLTRQQGLIRLIVPSEKKDALRQVKWVGHLSVRA